MSKQATRETFARALADAPDPANLQPEIAPERTSAGALVVPSAAAPPPVLVEDDPDGSRLDPNGFDPADYDWVPVKRVPRPDGWSHARQRAFIEALADCGSVSDAAREIGMSPSSAYRLRRSPGGESFARAWDAAIQQAALHLVDLAFDRAIHGSDEPVFDREGRRVGRRMRHNDRLLMFLLRAHLPERYAHAHREARPAAAPPAAAPAPVALALAALEPVAPAEPHRLLSPEALDDAIELADLGDGRLPHWLRDPEPDPEPEPSRIGPEHEALLDDIKRANAPSHWRDPDEPEDDDEDG